MVISQIKSIYRDENDLLRTVIKRIYEQWDPERKQWHLKKIEYIFEDPEYPIPSDTPEISVETRHGWLIPPEWEFITEAWEYTRQAVDSEHSGDTYDHEGEVENIRYE